MEFKNPFYEAVRKTFWQILPIALAVYALFALLFVLEWLL